MASRMDRYGQNTTRVSSTRSRRNKELYNNIGKNTKYTNFTDISKVDAIDLNEAKRNYQTREGYRHYKDYNEFAPPPKVKKELDDFNYLYQDHENRVYDINKILKEAREARVDYDELDKKRKLKNTNYNILASLNPEELEKYRKEKENLTSPDEEELRDLIDTITSKTLKGEIDHATSVDLLSELMTSNLEDQVPSPESDEKLNISKDILDKETMKTAEILKPKEKTESDILKDMDQSFYTRSMDLSDKDFNFSDKEEGPSKLMTFLKVSLLLALVIGIITAIYFLIKTF